eukprot:TRINITY_DN1141_c0_g1_i3.p1 TRINITY_DN1141_c0_g1~~TRINITY_DN1141_c0_g1_i3.p1  ORF type:complete len:450 (+),score=87.14 TRINITY_DN1141_c0_g1_i3:152-1501(+)
MTGEAAEEDENHANEVQRVVFIAAGASHTVAVLSGDFFCSWGRGEDGQLGHGDATERHVPTVVSALDGMSILTVACGADHTIAYSEKQKTIFSWGWGDFGRLGHGNSTDLFIPQPIQAFTGRTIRNIACGDCHCLAVMDDGEVFSWGRNQNGQLGIGNTEDALLPQVITSFKDVPVKMVAAGAEHTAAVTEDGRLWGWGWGRYGNLGLGDRRDRLLPESVTSVQDEKMTLVACGWRHSISVTEDGRLFSYGWSKYGQLGHGDFEDHLVPRAVAALGGKIIAQIAGGWRHSVALDSEGKLYAWGWNKFGQVGVGDTEDHNLPQEVIAVPEKVVQVSCGWRHTVCLTEYGNVYTWGRGTNGQLGHGDTNDRCFPKRLELLSADGAACQGIAKAPVVSAGVTWIAPSERYAVVPNEQEDGFTVPSFSSGGSVPDTMTDASVPDAEMKRQRFT